MTNKLVHAARKIDSFAARSLKKYGVARKVLVILWHMVGVVLTYWLAFLIRFDGDIPPSFAKVYIATVPVLLLISFVTFMVFRLYSGLWAFFSIGDLVKVGLATSVAIALFGLTVLAYRGWDFSRFPRSVLVVEYLLLGIWVAGGRLAVRYFKQFRGLVLEPHHGPGERMLLIGRASDADLVIRETRAKGLGTIVGVMSDDVSENNLYLHGVRVIHSLLRDIGRLVEQVKPESILILPPHNKPRQINKLMSLVSHSGHQCKFRTIPALGDLATGDLSASSIRSVDIEDLLSRGAVSLDRTEVRRYVKGKAVMVTGAGGSIGSELTRQVARYEPRKLVLAEQNEYGLYTIEQELRRKYPNLEVIPATADIRHETELEAVFEAAGKVDVIYHAAAYKHVPLMEANVAACFRTNVLGTAALAMKAVQKEVDRFVMVSSDKAVRPSSIMGATKRIAERVISEIESRGTTFVSVRFGNVLGSSGSVIPLFKSQIEAGGPITVTTADIRRFFMTIPEAVDLVLQAGTIGRNGEIMVLEMGEEIKIIDLARRLIELSGLVPDRDIRIEITGLRPGEKEFEEVMTEDENVVKTALDKVWVMKKNTGSQPLVHVDLQGISKLVEAGDSERLRALAKELVPENSFRN